MNDTPLSSPTFPGLIVARDDFRHPVPVENRPRTYQTATSLVGLAWAVRIVSLLNMLNAVLPYQPRFIYGLGRWVPFEISEGHRFRMFLMSILLIILASGLQRGKKLAWQLTIAGLMLAPVLHLGRAVIWPQAIVNLTLVGFLIYHRRHFIARSDERSVRSGLVACSLLLAGLLFFGTARIHSLHQQTSGDHSWPGSFQTASELVVAHQSRTQIPLSPQTQELFMILRTGGTTIFLLGLVLVLRPVPLVNQTSSVEDKERAKKLIELHGDDPFNSYALLDDKSYFFACDDETVVPYVLSNNLAVALVDPIGPSELRPAAIGEFVHFCRCQDWEPVFYAASEGMRSYYEEVGLSLFKIGEGARIRADEFHLKGSDFQNLRTICNRAHRLGITFRWYDEASGIDRWLERQLAFMSHQWLAAKKGHEMTFDMGAFSIEDIRRDGAAVAFDSSGVPLAFATWRPFDNNRGRALDLMRHGPDARNVMDYVLVESIAHFRALGVSDISLGLAPMANTESDPALLAAEDRAVKFIFNNLNRVYGYKSLFEFKRKYRPTWRSRYVAYRRGVNLPLIGLALVRVHAPKGIMKFLLN
jgi:phosphatidylglycerol lysyltransferase